jgi:predicted ATPase with chaperone activity
LNGAEAEIVTVEAWFEPAREGTNAPARTEVSLSGLPDAVVRDARTRVLTALTRVGLGPGPGRLHLNLVPAGRRKRGELLDLPLALAASAASGHLDVESLASLLCLGELGIDGRIHATTSPADWPLRMPPDERASAPSWRPLAWPSRPRTCPV